MTKPILDQSKIRMEKALTDFQREVATITTAISLCMDNRLPIIVFNLNVAGNIRRVVLGEKIGSMVSV